MRASSKILFLREPQNSISLEKQTILKKITHEKIGISFLLIDGIDMYTVINIRFTIGSIT
jgi:hypothetical protein